MTPDLPCGYSGDRDAALVGLLYGELEPGERGAFESHLPACARCRTELAELRGIRADLKAWAPPVPPVRPADRAPARHWAALRDIPAWAQVAAAILILGVSAAIANVNVRYDASGLSVRTGWSAPAIQPAAAQSNATPWRADLAALEHQLRTEIAPRPDNGTAPVASHAAASDAELLRRVRALLDESERRQRRELALRVAEVVRDVDAQRRADLIKIDRSLGLIQNNTGVEVLRQRELLNYLVRTSQKQ